MLGLCLSDVFLLYMLSGDVSDMELSWPSMKWILHVAEYFE